MKPPRTLQEAIVYFADSDRAFDYAVKLRWPDGKIICPRCSSGSNYHIRRKTKKGTARLWLCRGCNRQFTLKVNTIFEDSPITLDKWMTGFWMLVNCKNGISSMEIHRTLGITQKSAWFMLQRLRTALHNRTFGSTSKLGGPHSEVEADETFVGGVTKNMHQSRRAKVEGSGPYKNKTIVQGILDRNLRQVRATVVPNVTRETLQSVILKNVKFGSKVYTDDAVAYSAGMDWRFVHDVINLFRYVDEQVFRYNNRKDGENKVSDATRFARAMSQVAGRRLTYTELTGKDQSVRHETTGAGKTPKYVPF